MSVEITPSVLEFNPPFTQPATRYITLTNNSEEVTAFKVKTTAPKLYCVRPNASIIEPGKSIDVSIILLGLKEEPASDFKCNDKFLIVALPAPYDLGEKSVADIWPELEAEFKPQSISKKIKVKYVFEKIEEAREQQNGSSINAGDAASAGVASSAGVLGAGAAASNLGHEANPASTKSIDNTQDELINEKKTLLNQGDLDDQSKIDALNEKLDSNLAQSNSSKQQDNKSVTKTQSVGNAPLTTVILIALIAFIVGWLFF